MNEFYFHAAIYVLGLSWALLALSPIGIGSCCVLAYPLGQAIWVSISIALVLSPIPFTRDVLFGSVASVMLAGTGLSLRTNWRGWDSPRSSPLRSPSTAILFSGLFGASAWLATRFSMTVWTNDSHAVLGIGRSIAHYGEIATTLGPELASRGLFQAILQGMSIFLDTPFLSANPAVLALSATAAFLVLGLRGLAGPGRASTPAVALVVLTTAAISTPYFVIVQYFYLHETYAAGVYLLLAASCFWLAEIERNPAWLPFAFVFALALSWHRVETPLITMIFLAMAIVPSRLPRCILNWGLAIHSSLVLVWLTILHGLRSAGDYHSIRGIKQVLTPQSISLIALGVATATLVIFALQHPRFAGLRTITPKLITGVLCVSLVPAFIWKFDLLSQGLMSTLTNMASLSWGGVWCAFLALGLMSVLLRRPPHSAILSLGPVATLAFILLLATQQHFRVSWADSGNRMLTYLIPTYSFSLLMVYGWELLGIRAEPRADASVEHRHATH
ncbi:MAG: hypothetical protein GY910_22015 [bacterium]|nr:hypothetical protein [bacterium]